MQFLSDSPVFFYDLQQKEKISFGCVTVALVFFLVLSQYVLYYTPSIVWQLFRPAIVGVLALQNWYKKKVFSIPRCVTFLAIVHCFMVTFMQDFEMSGISSGVSTLLFLMMFFSVIGTPFNNREIRFIMMVSLVACTICAVILLIQNGPFDMSHDSIYFKFANNIVNRNRNAYAFTLGGVIGLTFIRYGSGYPTKPTWIMTAICAYAVIYSQCRGAFLCLGLASIVLFLDLYKEVKHIGYTEFVLLIIGTLIVLIGGYYLISNGAASRLLSTTDTGRSKANNAAWKLFLDENLFFKLFGHGFMYELNNNGLLYGAHNVYINNLLSTGLYGVFLYIAIFVTTLQYIKGIVPYAFFLLAICKTMLEGMDYYVYIPLIFAVIIYQDFHERE